jgi:hypothetical protein
MKNLFLLFAALCFLASTAFAGEPVIIDETGTDFQSYWYTGTYGKQITLDDENKVHVAYCKTWCTDSDTGYQVMYANVTDDKKFEIPSQEPGDPIQPGFVNIGGGKNGTPIYLYYGAGGRMYSYGDAMHLQAMAQVNSNGTAIIPLGMQDDKSYNNDPHYANPIAMEVDEADGIAHCILTNPGGDDVAYWNFDGTNFGEIYNLLDGSPGGDIPGRTIPLKYRRNGTKGADLTISSDGTEVTVATLHTASNILLHKGYANGDVWAEDFLQALDDGDIIALFDTTDTEFAENIPNNDPKPFTDLQVKYDADGILHVVYEATYIDNFFDLLVDENIKFWWGGNLYGSCGDENASFYDGTEHPKPQLRYWNSTMPALVTSNTHTLVAECEYPKAGETYEWFSEDGNSASWGKYINDSLIGNLELVVNKDPQEGEPKMVVVWEETQGDTEVMYDADAAFGLNYYAYRSDLKVSVSDGDTWSAPSKITDTADKDEREVSVYGDVIDNKIHMMYYVDDMAGCDRQMVYQDAVQDQFVQYAPSANHFSVPIRKPSTSQVQIVYQELDLTTVGVESKTDKLPVEFSLEQNYPNPFNPTTDISYTVPAGDVRLDIYNALGQKVKTLVDQNVLAGKYSAQWDGTNADGHHVTSGLYFYRLESDAGVKVNKMMLQK